MNMGRQMINGTQRWMRDAQAGREHRATRLCEVRVADGDTPTITGYAAVYDSPTTIGSGSWAYTETVKRGAFDTSLARGDNVAALVGHDPDKIIGRNTAGTLSMRSDDRGLAVTITPPDTQVGRDVVELVRRGDLDSMSFGFVVADEEWRSVDGVEHRDLLEVDLFDVSIVTYPAYQDTSVALRSRDTWQAEAREDGTYDPKIARARLDLVRVRG